MIHIASYCMRPLSYQIFSPLFSHCKRVVHLMNPSLAVFKLYVEYTLRNPSSAVFILHISFTLQNPVLAVFVLHVACIMHNLHFSVYILQVQCIRPCRNPYPIDVILLLYCMPLKHQEIWLLRFLHCMWLKPCNIPPLLILLFIWLASFRKFFLLFSNCMGSHLPPIASLLIDHAITLLTVKHAQVLEPLCSLCMIVTLTTRIRAPCEVFLLLILHGSSCSYIM